MLNSATHAPLHSRTENGRTARVWVVSALATGVVASLSFAQPALAADGTEPVLPLPVLPGIVDGAAPLPDPTQLQPEDLEPVVSVTQTEDGDLNVTVRVLSPGDDGPVTQGDSLSTVISDAPAADITDDPDTADPGAATPSREPAGSANTNVSVRVLSPGDNGALDQDAAVVPVGVGAESDPSSSSSADRPLGSTLPSSGSGDDEVSPERDSAQYQDENSQYQSSTQSASDQWTWFWNLTLDCSGNAISTSTESGNESSLNWAWNWMWDWGCDHTEGNVLGDINPSAEPAPADAAESQGSASTIAPTSSPTGPSSAPAPAQSQLASGMWVWTWTFTHCGRTTSLSTTTSSQTALTWAWDWMWTWVCPAAEEGNTTTTTPPANDAASPTALDVLLPTLPEPSAQVLPPAAIPDVPFLPSLPAVFEAPFVPLAEATITAIFTEQTVPTWALEILGPPATVAPTIGITGLIPSPVRPAAQAPTEVPHQGLATDPDDPRSVAVPQPTSVPVRQHSRSRSTDQRARPTHEAKPQAPRGKARGRSSLFDDPRRLQAAGSAGTSGGVAPSGLNVVSAALTGLFIFAAPEVGRRIRVARGLSPRSRHRSPIDHPG